MSDSLRDRLQETLGAAYAVERELGGGGMSRVFLATDTRLNRQVVVKVLSPELAAGLSADRFEREILLAASLQQANIVPVLAAGEMDGLPYFTMPFVEGESLRTRLAAGERLPIGEVVSILRDVVHALEYAHARGVVHRDIKPDNILLSGGTAVVTDFGIAKALSAAGAQRPDATSGGLTQMGTAIGTPAYMSPEQAAGDPDVDQRSDIYALGCVAYELLAGAPPFAGRSPSRTLAAHMAEAPRPVTELRADTPPSLALLVTRCLEKDPSARPQSAREVAHDLQAATSGASHETLGATSVTGPAAFRRAALIYVVVFVFVAVLAKAAEIAFENVPQWLFAGAVTLMLVGLPFLLFAGWAHRVHRRTALATPAPGASGASMTASATLAMKATPYFSWSRLSRSGGYALAAFAAVVVAYMVLRALGIGPAGSLMANQGWLANDRLLVTAFSAKGGADSSLGSVVSEAMRTDLSEAKGTLSIISASAIRAALQRMTLAPESRVTLAIAQQMAPREGIKAIIDGDVTAIGPTAYILTGRIVNPRTGDELATYHENAKSPDDLIPAVQRLSRSLRKRMGESLKGVQSSPPLDAVTTSSLDALKKYSEAAQLADFKRDYKGAAKLYREATVIDSNFGMAWRKLAVSLSNAGLPRAQVDSAATRAFLLADRMPDHEKYTAIGYYWQNGPHSDRAKAIEAYEHVVNDGGPPDAATHNLASLLASRREYGRADSLFRRRLDAGELAVITFDQYANGLVYENKLGEADSVIADATKRFPTVYRGFETIPTLYLRGQLDSIASLVTTLTTDKDQQTAEAALGVQSGVHLIQGKLTKALADLRTLRAQATARGEKPSPLDDSVAYGWISLLFEHDPDAAYRHVERGLAAVPLSTIPIANWPSSGIIGIFATSGHPDRARAIMQQYDAAQRDTVVRRMRQPDHHEELAEILLAEKKPQEAIAEFRRSDSLPDGPNGQSELGVDLELARSFTAANQADSAIYYYERYLSLPDPNRLSTNFDAAYLPGVLRSLGELYEAKGDRAKAIGVYQRFVTLWKNADASLQPQVAEIKKRIDRLSKGVG